jgi:hypothetical protein
MGCCRYRNRGSAYCGEGDYDRAISDFDPAIAACSSRGNAPYPARAISIGRPPTTIERSGLIPSDAATLRNRSKARVAKNDETMSRTSGSLPLRPKADRRRA